MSGSNKMDGYGITITSLPGLGQHAYGENNDYYVHPVRVNRASIRSFETCAVVTRKEV